MPFLYFFLLTLIFATPAYAYLDPGSISIILQALAAGLLAVGIFWRRVLAFLKGIFKKKS